MAPKGPKKCRSCKNHDIDQWEAGHRPCPFKKKDHLDKCKRCRKNQELTKYSSSKRKAKGSKKGTAKSRKREHALPINRIQLPALLLFLTLISTVCRLRSFSLSIRKDGSKQEGRTENDDNVFIIFRYNYPRNKLSQNNVDQINEAFWNGSTTMENSNYLDGILDNGTYRIKTFNDQTSERLKEFVKTLKFTPDDVHYYPFILMSDIDFSRYIYMTCQVRKPIMDYDFLPAILSENAIDSSRWLCDDPKPDSKGMYRIDFAIDPLTLSEIENKGLKLIIQKEIVDVEVVKNPFVSYMFEEVDAEH